MRSESSHTRPNTANPSTSRTGDFEYAAFISYRHVPRDQEVAKRVQKAVETFKMPYGTTAFGRTDRRLGKCFRDEDELAAAHSLPDSILQSLEKSSSLVVVCSPDTQGSVWVQREIEAFIRMHGRERVFAVLADGSSAESIPKLLRPEATSGGSFDGNSSVLSDSGSDDNGSVRANPAGANADASRDAIASNEHASPLAADLRPGISKNPHDEMLRLIAAIAGCGYDDLKQRDRARTRKRTAIAIACAVIAFALVADTIAFVMNTRQNAQIEESLRLAAESEQLLSQGDRYGAIEKALEALPRSESSTDKPLVPEARTALENALEVIPDQNTAWLASYEIRTEAPLGYLGSSASHEDSSELNHASEIAVSTTGGYFAISDSAGHVSTYDLVSGRKLADCPMPEEAAPLEGGLYYRTMGATDNYLVVANGGDSSVLAIFDARTGELVKSASGTGCPSLYTLPGSDYVFMSFPLAQGGYSAAIADLEEGAMSSINVTDVGAVTANPGSYFNTPGDRLGDNYSAFGNRLFFAQIDGDFVKSVELAYPEVTSLEYIDGMVLAASAETMTGDDVVRRYAIEAFDGELTPIWKHDGSFTSEMIKNSGVTSLLSGDAVVRAAVERGSKIVASVGRRVIVLDSATGKLVDETSFDQTIVGLDLPAAPEDSQELVAIACGNGTINCQELASDSLDVERDARRLVLPFPIRWARFADCGESYVLLAVPADSDNRIVSFRTNWTREEPENEAPSLDELIELAAVVLSEGGRG